MTRHHNQLFLNPFAEAWKPLEIQALQLADSVRFLTPLPFAIRIYQLAT